MTAKAQEHIGERTGERIAWIDYARGFSIILVVMMHSTLGVEASLGRDGWLHEAVAFAKPFRIPAFFLVSGLLVSRVIDRDWRTYLDSRVLHFVYFYVLWVTIQFLFKFPGFAAEQGIVGATRLYLEAFVQPFGTLWFIYLLPIFFLVVKLLRRVSPVLIFSAAALLETLHLDTGSVVIDEFASRFVFFYAGYVLAQYAFRLASWSERHVLVTSAGMVAWLLLNGALVYSGFSERPFISLMLGFLGAGGIIALSALLARRAQTGFVRFCGENSLPIYLAFFLPMAAARIVINKSGLITDVGTEATIVTAVAVAGALLIHRLAMPTRLRFLFERPDAFRLKDRLHLAAQR
jgi:uncharacterized membrane protein YcfT